MTLNKTNSNKKNQRSNLKDKKIEDGEIEKKM